MSHAIQDESLVLAAAAGWLLAGTLLGLIHFGSLRWSARCMVAGRVLPSLVLQAVRFALTAVVVYLLKLPGLMLIGGLLLLPIAWKLLHHDDGADPAINARDTFWSALRTIIVADALMGMDNVLAIAGASSGHLGLVILGLLISIPLVVWGSTLILKLIGRFPVIMYVGAGAIAFTAGRMITHDPWLGSWLDMSDRLKYGVDAVLVIGICGGGWLMQRCR